MCCVVSQSNAGALRRALAAALAVASLGSKKVRQPGRSTVMLIEANFFPFSKLPPSQPKPFLVAALDLLAVGNQCQPSLKLGRCLADQAAGLQLARAAMGVLDRPGLLHGEGEDGLCRRMNMALTPQCLGQPPASHTICKVAH